MFGNFQPKGSLIYFVESCGLDCTVLITRDYNWFIDQDGAEPLDTSTFPILTFFPEVMRSTTPKEFSTDKHIDPFPSSFPTLSEPELIIGTETIPPSFKITSTEFSTDKHIDPFPIDPIPPLLERTSTEFSTDKHIDPFPSSFSTLSDPELIIGTETIPPSYKRTSTEFSTDKHIDPFPNPFPTLSEPELIIGTETIPPLLERTSTEFSTEKYIDPFPISFPTLPEHLILTEHHTDPSLLKRTPVEFSTEQHIDPYPGYSTETLLVKTDEFPALFNERLDIDVSETSQCLQVGVECF